MISVGLGIRSAAADEIDVDTSDADALAVALDALDGRERWWSGHRWGRTDSDPPHVAHHRLSATWQECGALALDLDWLAHARPGERGAHQSLPMQVRESIGALSPPGSLWHATPRGVRLVFALARPISDGLEYERTFAGALALAQRWCDESGLAAARGPGLVPDRAVGDRARVAYAPRAIVAGTERDGVCCVLRRQPYQPEELAASAPASALKKEIEPVPARREPARPQPRADAVERYLADHPADYPTRGLPCPACDGKDSFKRARADGKWCCFHASHPSTVGLPSREGGASVFVGSQLDLDAHEAGRTPAEHLRAEGYLQPLRVVRAEPEPEPEALVREVDVSRGTVVELVSRSISSAMEILPRVLPGPLTYDEMRGEIMCGPSPLDDDQITEARRSIEAQYRDGRGKMLQFDHSECWRAASALARRAKHHPVRDYLSALPAWDGVDRVGAIAQGILGVADSHADYATAVIRRWLVSAVARAFEPGCKVDHMLILAGPQGVGKSSFFRILGGKWFLDSEIHVDNKDGLLTLRRGWIIEWSELRSVYAARTAESVKAFLTQSVDSYRPPYARAPIEHPRSCVFGGTSNDSAILSDPSGGRRFWIVSVGAQKFPLEELAAHRDAIWAQAVALYRAGEKTYLTFEEEAAKAAVDEDYQQIDPWEDVLVRAGLPDRLSLAEAFGLIGLDPQHRKPSDQKRVIGVLERLGFERRRSRSGNYYERRR